MSAVPGALPAPMDVHVVAPAGPFRDRLMAAFGASARAVDPTAATEALGDVQSGLVVVDEAAVTPGTTLALVARAAGTPGRIVALVRDGDPPVFRTLSLGKPCPLDAAARFSADPVAGKAHLLDLDRALRELSRIRHDVNNQLTGALTEAQLLLMDGPASTDAEALRRIEHHLLAVRELVVSSNYLRP